MASFLDPSHRTRFIVTHQGLLLLSAFTILQSPFVTLIILLAPLLMVKRTHGRDRATLLISVGIGVLLAASCAALMVYLLAGALAGGRV